MKIIRDEADGKPVQIRMRKPADMHQHLRQGEMLKLVAPMVAARFCSAIIMPNTIPPITREEQLPVYWQEIRQAAGADFTPLMTMYLTESLDPRQVARCLANKTIVGIKYYPRGLTTNSDSGVANPASLWDKTSKPYEILRVLAEHQGVLLLHAADGYTKSNEEIDPYDQEKHFLTVTLPNIVDAHPALKISVEHLSTAKGAEQIFQYGRETNGRIGCSITAHHLLYDRRDVFRGGFNPHRHWWPIIQPKEHKDELRKLVAQGLPYVWLGSDSAPHPVTKKEAACCVGGVLTAHAGIELYAEAFEDSECLEKLESFASVYGPQFYGLAPSDKEIVLERNPWKVEKPFYIQEPVGDTYVSQKVVPLRLGEEVRWRLVS